ncbi:dihydropteroate synthase [Porticoccus sp. W117]|uniref:dihydropteroate synthase n=1 Tax=Porticoccus sp. W117 TaxID=3054777 RepID=UPI0025939C6E|nr:dihydropteroate synthase [Porticoccus sp. W117]MDM3871298.1 dihydropteroate synthase [Porticoccus sp. W117]
MASELQLLPNQPQIMGILNVTPDSFSDGGQLYHGQHVNLDRVLRTAEQMVADGADILDIGGESTRPGAAPVSVNEELDRVVPVVEALSQRLDVALSVDTSSPQVMMTAATAGAALINDVRALQREGAMQAAAATGLPVCLMHMQGEPGSMQADPRYVDVVQEVGEFLDRRIASCLEAGIEKSNIVVDPGFGFGKTLAHNLALFRALPSLVARGLPVLVGVSRKRMIGTILSDSGVERDVGERLMGSVTLALLAAQRGAAILRVHDVKETADALRMWAAVENNNE